MDMNNPQMQAMAAQMMADPEILSIMQQPGMMEKIQGVMQNPASAMSDPDLMRIVMKLQGMGMGGGGGGMGGMGGMGGGMGGYSPPAAASASAPANIQHITTSAQLASLLAAAPKGSLVVIDYFTTWCGPCKAIAPLFSELATRYAGKVGFVKVDGDKSRDLVLAQGVSGYPTFEFYVDGQKIESFAGADQGKLQRIVEEYGEFTAPPPPCPYKHFPLREAEAVKYADIKWELVTPKFREFNSTKFALGDAAALSESELKSLDSLLGTIQTKSSYHSSSISKAEFDVVVKMVNQWPKDCQGPVLNLLRMAVMHPEFAATMSAPDAASAGKPGDLLAPLLKLALSADKSVLSLLALRALVNCFSRRAVAKKVLAPRYEEVLEGVSAAARKYPEDQNVRLSVVAVYINFAILFAEDPRAYEQSKVLLLTSVQELLQAAAADAKVAYRCAIVIGTLAYNDANVTELARDLDILDAVNAAANSAAGKADPSMQQVAAELQQLIKLAGAAK